jgi:hypothetical protein
MAGCGVQEQVVLQYFSDGIKVSLYLCIAVSLVGWRGEYTPGCTHRSANCGTGTFRIAIPARMTVAKKRNQLKPRRRSRIIPRYVVQHCTVLYSMWYKGPSTEKCSAVRRRWKDTPIRATLTCWLPWCLGKSGDPPPHSSPPAARTSRPALRRPFSRSGRMGGGCVRREFSHAVRSFPGSGKSRPLSGGDGR